MNRAPVARSLAAIGSRAAVFAWCCVAELVAQAGFDPLPWLVRLSDADRRATVVDEIAELPLGHRVTVWRRGLWLDDAETAALCAMRVAHDQVGRTEAKRVVDLLSPYLANADLASDWFEEFRQMVGSSELGALFAAWPQDVPGWWSDQLLGELHRQVRVAHVPALCVLARDPGAHSGEAALRVLGVTVIPTTDQYRETIGAAYLARVSGGEQPVAKPDGYPPQLAACLEWCLVRQTVREGQWEEWVCRWARDETPGDTDLPLLRQLAVSDGLYANIAAIHGLGRLESAASMDVLRGLHLRLVGNNQVQWFARAVMARRGDREAHSALEADSGEDGLALALLLWAGAERGQQALLDHLRSGDPDRLNVAVDALTRDDLGLYGVWRDEAQLAGLRDALHGGSQVDGWAIARIVAAVPSCRDLDLANRAAADAGLRSTENDVADDSLLGFLAFLEVCDLEAAAGLLRAWSASDDEFLRDYGFQMLSKLSLPADAPGLVAWIADGHGDEDDVRRLGALRVPVVEEYLRASTVEVGDDEDRYAAHLAALAVFHGMPFEVSWIGEALQLLDGGEVRESIRSGQPTEALGQLLDAKLADPRAVHWIENLGLVKGEPARGYLRALQQRRELGLYTWATGELMLMGEPDAMSELMLAFNEGRYRWVEDASPRVRTFNRDLGLLSHWTGELESNCCRAATADGAWEELLGFELGTGPEPRVTRARRWWMRWGSDLRWSRLADCWVPGPR